MIAPASTLAERRKLRRAILERTAKARAAIDAMIGGRRPKTVAPMIVKRKPPKPAAKKMLPEKKRTRAPEREAGGPRTDQLAGVANSSATKPTKRISTNR